MKIISIIYTALLIGLMIPLLLNCKKEAAKTVPTVIIAAVSNITATAATCGGTITSDGGETVISCGVCWSTNQNPTIADYKTTDGKGTGSFSSIITSLTQVTTYNLKAYATNAIGTGYSDQITFTTILDITLPILITTDILSVTTSSALCGGNVISDGNSPVIDRGVCWSTNKYPTISDNKTKDGNGTGTFTSLIIGINSGLTYYFRAYAINAKGTAYGDMMSFSTSGNGGFNPKLVYGTISDIDGNNYKTITIGTQTWMAENLKTKKYNNGDFIGTTSPATLQIYNESNPKYQWAYDGGERNVFNYGRLYTWYTVTDNRNLCPTGWHVPTEIEWTTFAAYLTNNDYGYLGNKSYPGEGYYLAKSMASQSGWNTSSMAGEAGNDQANNNTSGFSALPGGVVYNGYFNSIGELGEWWSSTTSGISTANTAWCRYMVYNYHGLSRYESSKIMGLSVRCIKD